MEYSDANVTPDILRNKGVPVDLAAVDANGNAVDNSTVIAYVRFTNNALADVEEAYGSLSAWQKALEETPARTIRRTLAIVFVGWPIDAAQERQFGERMTDSVQSYGLALGAAWTMANGVDPTRAALLIHRQWAELQEQMSKVAEEIDKVDEEPAQVVEIAS